MLTEQWAAGFFEGEGYVGVTHQTKPHKADRLVLTICQVDRRPLDTFRDIFDVGTVRGPYGPYAATKKAYYQYQTSGDNAVAVLQKMQPFLFRKNELAQAAIAEYEGLRNAV